ncbi:MAG: hypothetical protein Q8S39_04445, partial [Ignavibacteria bacterium]|nr:hypothetical protein [Ignavibacteria bacterium]
MSELALYYRYFAVVSSVVWLITPIRQYKTRYFWFFLTLGLADPVSIVLSNSFQIIISQLYIPISILSFFSVVEYKKIAIHQAIFYIAIIGLGFFSSFHVWEYGVFFFTAVLFLVLVIIVKQSFQFVVEKGSINIFHIVLA